jgi:hypothetical protein
MTGDRVWWKEGRQYRELAASLRDVARKCRLADPQLELIDLARRYERRADQMDRSAAFIRTKFSPAHR